MDWVPRGSCKRCQKRPATVWWSEGAIAFVHGMRTEWCQICVLEVQIEHITKQLDELPKMAAELDRLKTAESKGG